MKEAAQCRQFDELRSGDGMVGQVMVDGDGWWMVMVDGDGGMVMVDGDG